MVPGRPGRDGDSDPGAEPRGTRPPSTRRRAATAAVADQLGARQAPGRGELAHPLDNAWMAYQVWDAADGNKGNGRGSWKPWSVYNPGSYKTYLRESGQVTDPASVCVEAPPGPRSATPPGTCCSATRRGHRRGHSGADLHQRRVRSAGDGQQRRSGDRVPDRHRRGLHDDHRPDGVPIFYRTDKYTAIEQGRQRAFPAGGRSSAARQGHRADQDKWVTWVQLQDNATQETSTS